ncbi:hypothetical protein PsorP6_015601 [Peronosclerospora sorghi]|uniref:Uncharacterized protein n=1 Tax=Peronosclerospora sorghi TaxID=230839 RepID=A0ACC0WLV4_9STRA|nr:hypothetical protein PsorP6_015601 [Peronosclerospora sorghi]
MLLWSLQSVANVAVDEVIEKLTGALDQNTQILTTARHLQQQRTEAQLLRAQQDLEYQESLAADRRREQLARERAEREEQEKVRQEEETRRAQAEQARQAQQLHAEIQAKRLKIANGPTSRVPPRGADYETVVLKFHLHTGTRLEHMFYAHDTLETRYHLVRSAAEHLCIFL